MDNQTRYKLQNQLIMSNSIVQAFKGLNVDHASVESDHEHIFDIAYQYLSIIKEYKDANSFQVCLVALINLEKYNKAVHLISRVPIEYHQNLEVEKAYTFYKVGKSDMLRELYNSANFDNPVISRALKHIMAQDYYRSGFTRKSLELYHELLNTNSDFDNSVDLLCNERAVVYQLGISENFKVSPMHVKSAEVSYDLLLNDALIALAQRDFKAAFELLERAEQLCRQQNDQSGSAAELNNELVPLLLTKAYLHELNNEKEEASSIIDGLNLEQVNDPVVRMIIKNNMFSLRGIGHDFNVNLIQRDVFDGFNNYSTSLKLTAPQKRVLLKNYLQLEFFSGTLSKKSSYISKKFLENWVQIFPRDYTPFVYKLLLKLNISHEKLNSDPKEASHKLFKLLDSECNLKNEEKVAGTFLLVSLNAEKAFFDQSVRIAEKLVNEQINSKKLIPPIVSLLIKLYEHLDLFEKLSNLLQQVKSVLLEINNQFLEENDSYIGFAKFIGFKLLLTEARDDAHALFEKLLHIKEDSLLKAVVQKEHDLSPESFAKLDSLSPDINALLSTDIQSLAVEGPKSNSRAPHRVIKVTKRKRKPKFSSSKNLVPDLSFNPENLDQERWYPMKLRSYYKPTKKELKKKSGGHQGSITPAPAVSTSSNKGKKKKKGKK